MKRYSSEQIRAAKELNLVDWLERNRPGSLKKTGRDEWTLLPHSSFRIGGNNRFIWYKGDIKGYGVLDYLTKYEGMTFVEAMRSLVGDSDNGHGKNEPEKPYAGGTPAVPPKKRPTERVSENPAEAKPFALPPRNGNNDRVTEYLLGRGISRRTVLKCLGEGILYENEIYHACIFVGMDGDTPRYAYRRATRGDTKGELYGSRKMYGFLMGPETEGGEDTVHVFESPIDALAHHTLALMADNPAGGETRGAHPDGVRDGYRLSLGGQSPLALCRFLETHPRVEKVCLSLDNDETGRRATGKIAAMLAEHPEYGKLEVRDHPPPYGKDFADTVLAYTKETLYAGGGKP